MGKTSIFSLTFLIMTKNLIYYLKEKKKPYSDNILIALSISNKD
jgi:hypothetical protein